MDTMQKVAHCPMTNCMWLRFIFHCIWICATKTKNWLRLFFEATTKKNSFSTRNSMFWDRKRQRKESKTSRNNHTFSAGNENRWEFHLFSWIFFSLVLDNAIYIRLADLAACAWLSQSFFTRFTHISISNNIVIFNGNSNGSSNSSGLLCWCASSVYVVAHWRPYVIY